jgi:hypothetical protein
MVFYNLYGFDYGLLLFWLACVAKYGGRLEVAAPEEIPNRLVSGSMVEPNNSVLSVMSKQNSLRWLYKDVKVIFEFNAEHCPNFEEIKPLINNVNDVELICSRLVYEVSEHQQFSVLIRHKASESKRLLVYNHGHDGLSASGEIFANDFIRKTLNAGHDVLIVSMPFVGVNFFRHDFKVKTWDGKGMISTELLDKKRHDLFTLIDTGKSPCYTILR